MFDTMHGRSCELLAAWNCLIRRTALQCSPSELRPNYALASVVQTSGVEQLEPWGLGEDSLAAMLPADELTLLAPLPYQPGATCQVHKGKFRSQVGKVKSE